MRVTLLNKFLPSLPALRCAALPAPLPSLTKCFHATRTTILGQQWQEPAPTLKRFHLEARVKAKPELSVPKLLSFSLSGGRAAWPRCRRGRLGSRQSEQSKQSFDGPFLARASEG